MDYKNYEPTTQCFLSDDDIGEHPKSIFFNLDELNERGTLNSTYDYLLKDWFNDYIVLLPITTPLFFDLIQNDKKHSYKATPEKLKTIIQCLKTYNFDQIIYNNPISSDPPANPDFEHVSGFGIRVYQPRLGLNQQGWSFRWSGTTRCRNRRCCRSSSGCRACP